MCPLEGHYLYAFIKNWLSRSYNERKELLKCFSCLSILMSLGKEMK